MLLTVHKLFLSAFFPDSLQRRYFLLSTCKSNGHLPSTPGISWQKSWSFLMSKLLRSLKLYWGRVTCTPAVNILHVEGSQNPNTIISHLTVCMTVCVGHLIFFFFQFGYNTLKLMLVYEFKLDLQNIWICSKLRSQIKGYFSALSSTDYWHLQDCYGTCISSGKVVHSYCFQTTSKQDILHISSCLPYELLAT